MIKDDSSLKDLKNAHGLPLFGVSGYGESRPRIPHSKETLEPKNRRIDLRFLLAPVDLEDVMVQRR
jgi:outer membrane protein OmpA-like peptidoglycan-associated protein